MTIVAFSWYGMLADAVVLLHFGYVCFVIIGLVLVWIGFACRWRWVRGFWFRLVHLFAMGLVVAESVLGIACPLTVWEANLRRLAGQEARGERGFVQEWAHRLMFFELDEATFTSIYILFFVAMLLSFIVVRPHWPFVSQTQQGTKP